MAMGEEQLNETQRGLSPAAINAMVSKLVQDGQAQVKLTELFEDNFKYRERNSTLAQKLKDAEAKVPKDGDLVLTGDDVALFNEAKATGKSAKQLKDLVKEHGDLTTKVVELERKTKVAEIAEAENWKPSVLAHLTERMDLLGVEEVTEEVDDPEKDGEKKKVQVRCGFFNTKDAEGKTSGKKRLSEELAEFIPVLSKADAEGNNESGGNDKGVPLARQTRGDKVASTGTKSASKDFIGRRYARPGRKDEDK